MIEITVSLPLEEAEQIRKEVSRQPNTADVDAISDLSLRGIRRFRKAVHSEMVNRQ